MEAVRLSRHDAAGGASDVLVLDLRRGPPRAAVHGVRNGRYDHGSAAAEHSVGDGLTRRRGACLRRPTLRTRPVRAATYRRSLTPRASKVIPYCPGGRWLLDGDSRSDEFADFQFNQQLVHYSTSAVITARRPGTSRLVAYGSS